MPPPSGRGRHRLLQERTMPGRNLVQPELFSPAPRAQQ
jgi:hypothetical protein